LIRPRSSSEGVAMCGSNHLYQCPNAELLVYADFLCGASPFILLKDQCLEVQTSGEDNYVTKNQP
jgi:hypothetical protein